MPYVYWLLYFSGSTLEADLLILGIGTNPNTSFLKNSGIILRLDGTIETNEYLQTNIVDVYVGGDVAFSPIWTNKNLKATVSHVSVAHYHGKTAALNMIGKQQTLKNVPFFWTMFFGIGIR